MIALAGASDHAASTPGLATRTRRLSKTDSVLSRPARTAPRRCLPAGGPVAISDWASPRSTDARRPGCRNGSLEILGFSGNLTTGLTFMASNLVSSSAGTLPAGDLNANSGNVGFDYQNDNGNPQGLETTSPQSDFCLGVAGLTSAAAIKLNARVLLYRWPNGDYFWSNATFRKRSVFSFSESQLRREHRLIGALEIPGEER